MNKTDIAVTLYDTHAEAESSIKTLQQQVSATSMPVILPSFFGKWCAFWEG
jgi:hypothetical protein